MEYQIFARSSSLNNISERKLSFILNELSKIPNAEALKKAYMRYAEANIPVEYWGLSMEKNFSGEQVLLTHYNEYVSDLKKAFIGGKSFCLAGTHGTGKTLTSCAILKKACEKGYNCLYTTLSDIVHVLTKAPPQEVFTARKELMEVDFLVIDEFDNRFMATDNAADLFARSLESVLRTRSQNKMPTMMCTNSPNIANAFNGPLKASIGSLLDGYISTVIVLGNDFRKNSK